MTAPSRGAPTSPARVCPYMCVASVVRPGPVSARLEAVGERPARVSVEGRGADGIAVVMPAPADG